MYTVDKCTHMRETERIYSTYSHVHYKYCSTRSEYRNAAKVAPEVNTLNAVSIYLKYKASLNFHIYGVENTGRNIEMFLYNSDV